MRFPYEKQQTPTSKARDTFTQKIGICLTMSYKVKKDIGGEQFGKTIPKNKTRQEFVPEVGTTQMEIVMQANDTEDNEHVETDMRSS